MKLSQYAKKVGITYKAAYEHWKKGIVKGYQLPTGTIVITDAPDEIKKLINPVCKGRKAALSERRT